MHGKEQKDANANRARAPRAAPFHPPPAYHAAAHEEHKQHKNKPNKL
jgi:hypothetical protein